MIKSITPKFSAMLTCVKLYHEWKSPVPFWKDYMDYSMNGFVCVRPTIFWMAKVINLAREGEKVKPCWFVRAAVGDLDEMMFETLPAYLPFIAFQRTKGPLKDGEVTPTRVYKMDRFLRIAKWRVKKGCTRKSAG